MWPYWRRCGLVQGSELLCRQDLEVFCAQALPNVESSLLLAACGRQVSFWWSSDQDVKFSTLLVCCHVSCHDDNGLNLWDCKPAPIKCCPLLSYGSVAVKRHHDPSNSYKGKHFIWAGLQFQIFSPLSSWQETWQLSGRHHAIKGAESSVSWLTGSKEETWFHIGQSLSTEDL